MADNNNEEKLKITAELDTSKLKQQAQQGMQSVVNEEKKVENQSKQTSKAIDDIGQSGKNVGQALQQASSQGANALKQVGQEADKTAQKIANIDKSIQNIKLGQALGLASRFAGSDLGQNIGNSIGDALGMSNNDKSLVGSALQGFLGGAAAGAMTGNPLVAAGSALVAAATALLKAGNELQNASKSEKEKADLAVFEGQKALDQQRAREEFANLLASGSDYQLMERLDYERNQLRQSDEGIKALQDRANRGKDDYGFALTTQAKVTLAKNLNDALEHHLKTLQKIAALEVEEARRDREAEARVAKFLADEENAANAFVGPEIPDYIRTQREAEAEAFVGPEIPEHILAERNAEADAFVGPQIPELLRTWRDAKDEEEKGRQANNANSLLDSVNNIGQTRLSDSLTRVGGGVGYGSQMQSISSKVVDISKTLKDILEQMKNPAIPELNEGVF